MDTTQQNGSGQMEDFQILDFTPERRQTLKPDDGTGFKRVMIGDFDWRISNASVKTKEGKANPYVMMTLEFEAIRAHQPENAEYVGYKAQGWFGGDWNAPPMMKRKTEALLRALNIVGAFSGKSLIGRELTASIKWEQSSGEMDQETGETKTYTNDRIVAFRALGTARPSNLNLFVESRAAIEGLRQQGFEVNVPAEFEPQGGASTPGVGAAVTQAPSQAPQLGGGGTPPWQGQQAQQQAQTTTPQATGFKEDPPAADPQTKMLHTYRAHIAMKTSYASDARTRLESARWNPDGPIDANLLGEPTKSQYLAHAAASQPKAAEGGLPPLGGDELPPLGGGAAPEPPKTGTRRKPAAS